MKKVLLLLIVFSISLLMIGCQRNISFNLNEEVYFSLNNDNGYESNVQQLNDNLSDRVYFFKEYEQLTVFLEENEIDFAGKTKEKYTKEFFKEYAIIIYYYSFSHSGFEHEYSLTVKGETLFLTLIAYDRKEGNYLQIDDVGFKIFEIAKKNIEGIDSFNYKIKYEKH